MQAKKLLIRLLNIPFQTIFLLLIIDAVLLFLLPWFDVLKQERSPFFFYIAATILSWIGCFCFLALLVKLLKRNIIQKEIHVFVMIPAVVIVIILFLGPLILFFLGKSEHVT